MIASTASWVDLLRSVSSMRNKNFPFRIHLDKKRKVNKIIKEASGHIACEYSKRGNVFAWDISVPDSHIKIAKKIYKEN